MKETSKNNENLNHCTVRSPTRHSENGFRRKVVFLETSIGARVGYTIGYTIEFRWNLWFDFIFFFDTYLGHGIVNRAKSFHFFEGICF